MIKYHDEEWGVPLRNDDRKMFEFLVLDIFQAGLSWKTVLRKRESFREAFDNFDYTKIARYNNAKVEELLGNKNIIRNRMKIEATIHNAKLIPDLVSEYGSFCNYIWSFVNGKAIVNQWDDIKNIPPSTPLSDRISKDLKKRGFRFIGTTIVYAILQSAGVVNDHLTSCFRYQTTIG